MESELIAWLRNRLPPAPCLSLGLGDDAAVLQLGESDHCVVTVDLLTDQVHFDLAATDPKRIGRKALAVNLSDLAAMAAKPLAALVALALPHQGGKQLALNLYEGLLPLAEQYEMVIAGGDTNSWDGPLVICVTAIGQLTEHGPLVRSGARPGDQILVTGHLGGSILGRHLDFEPRVREALLLNERYEIHAAIDSSDGLSVDLGHLAEESHCGAIVESQSLPISQAVRQLAEGDSALEHALHDGEDFELILAVPPDEAKRLLADQPLDVPLTRIGEFTKEQGLWLTRAGTGPLELESKGYQH